MELVPPYDGLGDEYLHAMYVALRDYRVGGDIRELGQAIGAVEYCPLVH